MHRAELRFPLAGIPLAQAVEGALAVEAADGPEGSRVDIRRDGEVVRVEVSAGTVSDLRAALNSVVRLVDAAARSADAAAATAGERNH